MPMGNSRTTVLVVAGVASAAVAWVIGIKVIAVGAVVVGLAVAAGFVMQQQRESRSARDEVIAPGVFKRQWLEFEGAIEAHLRAIRLSALNHTPNVDFYGDINHAAARINELLAKVRINKSLLKKLTSLQQLAESLHRAIPPGSSILSTETRQAVANLRQQLDLLALTIETSETADMASRARTMDDIVRRVQ